MQKNLNYQGRRWIFWIGFFLLLLAFDVTSKNLLLRSFAAPIEIIPNFLKITVSKNPGVAFSIPIPNTVMLWLTPLLIAALTYGIARSFDLTKRLTRFCLALLLAGALGNYFDRLNSGAVTDFIAFSFWPSFNFADMYLTIGAFLLVAFYGKIKLTNS